MFSKFKNKVGTLLLSLGMIVTGSAGALATMDVKAVEEKILSEDAVVEPTKEQFTTTDEYMKTNANTKYVSNPQNMKQINFLDVAHTMFEAGKLEDETLYGMWQTEKGFEAWCGQYDETAMVYTDSPDAEYYAVYAGTMADDTKRVVEYQVGTNDYSGITWDDTIYDKDTGIVYIPRAHFYDEEGKIILNGVRVQLLYKVANPYEATTKTNVVIHTEGVDGDVATKGEVETDIYAVSTKIRLAEDEKALDSIKDHTIDKVVVNSVEMLENDYYYHKDTGILEIQKPASTVTDVEVYLKNSVKKDIVAMFTPAKENKLVAQAWVDKHPYPNRYTYESAWMIIPLRFNKRPWSGVTFKLNSTNNYFSVTYLPPNWGALPNIYQGNIDGSMSAILNKNVGWPIDPTQASSINNDMFRGAEVPEQTQTSYADEVTVNIRAAAKFHLYCSHMEVNGNLDLTGRDALNAGLGSFGAGVTTDTLGCLMKVCQVYDDGTMIIGLVNPTQCTQAGVGLYKVRWEVPYEEPKYAYMQDKRTVSTKIIGTTKTTVKKVDKVTGKGIAGTKFDVRLTNYNGNPGTITYTTVLTDRNGVAVAPSISLTRDTATIGARWITNADKVDPARIDATTSEQECRDWLNDQLDKAEAKLRSELEAEAGRVKVELKESNPAGGYKIEPGQNITGAQGQTTTITNAPIAKELTRSAKRVLEKNISWNFDKVAKQTKDKLSGGKFDIYVSNIGANYNENNPEAGKDTYTLVASDISAVDGKIQGNFKIQSNEKTFTSDKVQYVDNWNSLRPEDKTALASASHSEAEGAKKAQAQANQRATDAQSKFEKATHNIKIVEKTAPDGYHIETVGQFVVNADGTGQLISANGTGTIENAGQRANIAKVGMDGEPVSGAKLSVIRASDNYVHATWVSDGTVHEVSNLTPNTEYIIREEEFPTDYIKTKVREQRFKTDFTGKPIQQSVVNKKITFSKVDVAGNEIEGAHIVVKDENGNKVDEWISTKEPHKIKNLEEGKTYTLTETVQPGGLNLANTITFTATDKDQHLTMVDTISRAVKVDADGGYVAGALMQVLDKDGNVLDEWTTREQLVDMASKALTQAGAKYNKDRTVKVVNITDSKYKAGEKVVEVIFTNGDAEYFETDAEGKETAHRVRGLNTRNTYILHEEMAPAGLGKASDVEFQPDPEKDVEVRMLDTQTTFSKVDAGGEEIEGAKIQVIDEDGNVVDEWVSGKEPHIVQNLEVGKKYRFHEEVAPGGYVYAHDIEFTVNPVDNQHYTMIDVIHGVRKVDEHGNTVKGAKLQLVDVKTGKVVDEWVSGQNLIELTEEQQAKMDAGEEVTITNENGTYTITPINAEESTEPDTPEEAEPSEQSEDQGSSFIDTVTDLVTGNETKEERVFTLKKVDPDGNYSYYEIDRDGNETVHRISNAMATTDYKVVEVETPATYVKSEDVPLTPDAEKDGETQVVDKQIKFSKLDVTGDEVEGAKIEVIDENGKVVDEWISEKEVHYIENLEVGKKYTIKETITPGGYVQASAIDFEVTPEGIDAHYKMVDAIHRIIKIDPDKKPVKNARLAVYTKDGKKLDEWTTGQHIRDIKKEDIEKANQGKRVALESAYVQYTDEQLEGMFEDLDKAIEKTLPSEPEATPVAEGTDTTPTEDVTEATPSEEDVFTAEDYINKAFEYMNLTAEELEAHRNAIVEMFATLTAENVEEVRTKVHEYAQTVQTEVNKKLKDEAKDLSGVYLEKNEHSSGGYTLIVIAKNGTMKYIDIDEFGDEANHRVSGIVAGNTYVLKELQAPFGYINAPAMEFVADGYTDLKLTMIDQFVVERDTDVIPINPLMIGLGIAGVLLISGAVIVVLKKRKLA